jgi:hypothetical protein
MVIDSAGDIDAQDGNIVTTGTLGAGATTVTTLGATAITGSGILSIDDTTDTTSGTSGSIHTDGGVGIAKKLWVGDTQTISRAAGNMLLATNTTSANGDLFVIKMDSQVTTLFNSNSGSNTAQDILLSTRSAAGNVDVLRLASTALATFSGDVSIDGTTDTSSGTTGSIHTDGGVGIAKKLYVGTTATIAGVAAVGGLTSTLSADSAQAIVNLANTSQTASAAVFINLTDSTVANLVLRQNTGGFTTSGINYRQGSTVSSDGTGGLSLAAINGSGDVRVYAGGTTERMRIDSSGNVGIGVTDPDFPLEVYNASTEQIKVSGFSTVGGASVNAGSIRVGAHATNYLLMDFSATGEAYIENTVNTGLHLREAGTNVLTVKAGSVGIGTSASTPHADADDLLITGAANTGISIHGDNDGDSSIHFVKDGTGSPDNDRAGIRYGNAADSLNIWSAGNSAAPDIRIYNGVYIGDTTNNANMTQGLTINQGTNDDEIFALKSSDVAQPVTDVAETDTYFTLSKVEATSGGALLQAYKDSDGANHSAIALSGMLGETANTAKTSSGFGVVNIRAYESNGGTGNQNVSADGNLVSITNGNGTVRFIFDADGDSHQDVGTAWTNFDNEPDALITRSLGLVMDKASTVKTKWDDWGRDHKEDLIRTGIISQLTPEQEANGERALVNTSQVMRLHNGALWQLYTQIMDMAERLEENVPALRGKLIPQIEGA